MRFRPVKDPPSQVTQVTQGDGEDDWALVSTPSRGSCCSTPEGVRLSLCVCERAGSTWNPSTAIAAYLYFRASGGLLPSAALQRTPHATPKLFPNLFGMYPALTARLASLFRPDYTPGSPAPPAPRDADSGLASCTSPQGTTHCPWLAACNWQPRGCVQHTFAWCQTVPIRGRLVGPSFQVTFGGAMPPRLECGKEALRV